MTVDPEMWFEVFGGISVRRAGRPVALGGPQPRTVLAALLVERDRVVPVERLVELVWADQPPRNARRSVEALVSRIRSALQLETPLRVHDGYRLTIPPDTVSFERFTALAERVSVLAAGPDEQLEAITAALALCVGRPFGDLADEPFLVGVVSRLDELRLGLLEQRADHLLGMGRINEALMDAYKVMSESPWRERPHRTAMQGLHRSGRDPEALRAFQRYRALLAEAGLEPGHDIRMLEEAIVTGRAEARRPRVTVPARLGRLVGREHDSASIAALLCSERLVTISGPGGVGKTRLAQAVARDRVDSHPDGVEYVELATATSLEEVVQAIAAAGEVQHHPPQALTETVVSYYGRRRAMLVLDNCEQVIDAVASVIDRLLRAAPALTVLATSRQPLEVDGEAVYRLEPLAAAHAVELFLDRARNADRSFRSLPTDTSAIEDLCRRLDGLPLAIELAAAQVPYLSLQDLILRLEQRSIVLEGGRRRHDPRHLSLQRVLDWSWQLLTPLEQVLLRRLAIFTGGFELDAVVSICRDDDAGPVEPAMRSLVAKSLVTVVESAVGSTRYGLLETVRFHALDRLVEAGELEAVSLRHRDWFVQLLDQPGDILYLGPLALAGRYNRDFENIRAAIEFSLSRGDDEQAAALVAAGVLIWRNATRQAEARPMLLGMLERELSVARREMILLTIFSYAVAVGDHELLERHVPEMLQILSCGEPTAQAFARFMAEGAALLAVGDVDGYERVYLGLVDVRLAEGSTAAAAQTLASLAISLTPHGRLDAARSHAERAWALAQPDTYAGQLALWAYGHVQFEQGHHQQGIQLLRQAQAMVRRAGLPSDWGWAAHWAYCSARAGSLSVSRVELGAVLEQARAAAPGGGMLPEALTIAGWIALGEGDLPAAELCCSRAFRYQFHSPAHECHGVALAAELNATGRMFHPTPQVWGRGRPNASTDERAADLELVERVLVADIG